MVLTMNDAPEPNEDRKTTPPPTIRPPDLSRKDAAPESPLDKIKHSSPPAAATGAEPAVKVHVRSGENAGDAAVVEGIAPFNTRLIAVIIDIVLVWGIQLGLVLILPGFAMKLAWLLGLAYFVTRDSLPFLGGQSVGKKAMKIRAVTLDGKPLTGNWEPSLIRAGVLCIPFFFLLELYLLLTRESGPDHGRRLGDEWAKTKVIVETRPEATDGNEESD
jgi:uncharacterized RDD family membrane protein YckC